jgi:protein-tyrosine-phosphatase
LGHCIPELDDAIRQQLALGAHSTMLGNGNRAVIELSEALARVVPVDDPHFLYASDGASADTCAVAAVRAEGLDLSSHRARSMDESLADRAEAIFVMERLQELDVARRFPKSASKTYLLGACSPGRPDVDIVDPYLSNDDECRRVLALVGQRTADIARVVIDDVSPRAVGADEAATKDATRPGAE